MKKIEQLLEDYFRVNPESKMADIRKFLKENGISESEIHEHFRKGSASREVFRESDIMEESAAPDLDKPFDLPDDIKDDFDKS